MSKLRADLNNIVAGSTIFSLAPLQIYQTKMGANRERAQRNLYVLNLPLDATTEQFQELFAQLGSVEHAVILATLDHAARRRGFILMSDPSQARAAIEHLNGLQWHNYRIEVSFAIVQRSGTPFSYETSDTNIEERPLQPDTISAGHQVSSALTTCRANTVRVTLLFHKMTVAS